MLGVNYSKENIITYVDMDHSDSTNKLKTQQVLLNKDWNPPLLMYLQIGDTIRSQEGRRGIKKEKQNLKC